MAVEVSNVSQRVGNIEGLGIAELISVPTITGTGTYAVVFKQSHKSPIVICGNEIAGAAVSVPTDVGCTLTVTGATGTSVSILVIG
jgi:hypothetical protein